jgi:hypothetical protein
MGALTPLHIIIIVHYSPVIKSIAKLKTYDGMYTVHICCVEKMNDLSFLIYNERN